MFKPFPCCYEKCFNKNKLPASYILFNFYSKIHWKLCFERKKWKDTLLLSDINNINTFEKTDLHTSEVGSLSDRTNLSYLCNAFDTQFISLVPFDRNET